MNNKSVDELEKFLPLGSICKVKGGKRKVMITGFCIYADSNENKIYDYCGCAYPEGMLSTKEVSLFDHNEIEKVYIVGPSNKEDKEFKANLKAVLKEIEHTSNEVLDGLTNTEEEAYVGE